jgi:hypothetical protein
MTLCLRKENHVDVRSLAAVDEVACQGYPFRTP